MRHACIDIGSNTTRLLVADCVDGRLTEVHQERAFTYLAWSGLPGGVIAPGKLEEVAGIVAGQLETAKQLGCGRVRAVATAAIRRAPNGSELAAAVGAACGLDVEILTAEEEGRLAFVGAAQACGHVGDAALGVVDVGGGNGTLLAELGFAACAVCSEWFLTRTQTSA